MRRRHKNFHARAASALTYPALGMLSLLALLVTVGVWVFGMLLVPLAFLGVVASTAKMLGLSSLTWFTRTLAMFCLTFVGLSLTTVFRSLFFKTKAKVEGLAPVTLRDKRVIELIIEVGAALRASGFAAEEFDEVALVEGPRAYTDYRGRRRVLVLGAPLLLFLDEDELRSVIAHEYAHHIKRRMSFSILAWRVSESLYDIHRFMRNPFCVTSRWSLAGSWFSPRRWLPRWACNPLIFQFRKRMFRSPRGWRGSRIQISIIELVHRFLSALVVLLITPVERLNRRVMRHTSHRIEHECDLIAVAVTGADPYALALKKVTLLALAWEIYLVHWCREACLSYSDFRTFCNSGILAEFAPRIAGEWRRSGDQHPSGHERVSLVGASDLEIDPTLDWDFGTGPCLSLICSISRRTRYVSIWVAGVRRRALVIIESNQDLLEGCPSLRNSEEFIRALTIMMMFIPAKEIFKCYLRGIADVDRVTSSVLVCISRMIRCGLVGAYTATARQKQILLSLNVRGRPRRAIEILLGIWESVPKRTTRLRIPQMCRSHGGALLQSEKDPAYEAGWESSLAVWKQHREIVEAYLAAQGQGRE